MVDFIDRALVWFRLNSKGFVEGLKILWHTRHLDDVERGNAINREQLLRPFEVVKFWNWEYWPEVAQGMRRRIRHTMFVRFFGQEFDDWFRMADFIFLLVFPPIDIRQIGADEIAHEDDAEQNARPTRASANAPT